MYRDLYLFKTNSLEAGTMARSVGKVFTNKHRDLSSDLQDPHKRQMWWWRWYLSITPVLESGLGNRQQLGLAGSQLP